MRTLRNLKRLAQVVWILLAGCAGSSSTAVAPLADAVECRAHLHGVIMTAPDCPSAVAAIDIIIQTDPKCKGFDRIEYQCIKHEAGVQILDAGGQ